MNTPVDPVTCGRVRAALVELLTVGQHHHAATHLTLIAVGDARRALNAQYPTGQFADDNRRLTALTQALDTVSGALSTVPPPQHPNPTGLRDGLNELAAIALGWLDVLPDPPQSDPDEQVI